MQKNDIHSRHLASEQARVENRISVVPSSGNFVMHRKSLTPREFHNKAQGQRRSRATLGKDVNHDPKPQRGFTEKPASFVQPRWG